MLNYQRVIPFFLFGLPNISVVRCQVPAEMSPGSICTDQQMDTPDGRKEARKFAKSSLAKNGPAGLVKDGRNHRAYQMNMS